jgi:hypothetical protein
MLHSVHPRTLLNDNLNRTTGFLRLSQILRKYLQNTPIFYLRSSLFTIPQVQFQ